MLNLVKGFTLQPGWPGIHYVAEANLKLSTLTCALGLQRSSATHGTSSYEPLITSVQHEFFVSPYFCQDPLKGKNLLLANSQTPKHSVEIQFHLLNKE